MKLDSDTLNIDTLHIDTLDSDTLDTDILDTDTLDTEILTLTHWILETDKLQGVRGIVDSGKVLLWACFETSGVPEGLYVTPRLGTNYF